MTTKGENHCIAMHFIIIISYTRPRYWLHVDVDKTEHPAYSSSATDVARCRDGDISRVSLKYDAAECSPGLLSMEWYPSLIVPGRRRMFTSVGEHEMIPLLVPGGFLPVVLSMQAHMFFTGTHGTIPISLLVFVENAFTPLIY